MSQDNTQKQSNETNKPKFTQPNQDHSGGDQNKNTDDDKNSKQQQPKEFKKDDKNSIDQRTKN